MNNQDLRFPSEGAAGPRPDVVEAPPAPLQTPLTDRETAGFYRAMQDERDKRQALERRLADQKTASEVFTATPPERDLQITVYANNLKVSRRFAEREYGQEVISAVHDWAAAKCDSDPGFNATMRSSEDPYEAAKLVYDQECTARNIKNFPSAQSPPRSLADAPGNGAVGRPHVPVGDGNAYESLFN